MSVWDSESNCNRYILEYWESSSIEWQQKNRDILNEAIRIYNDYVLNKASLDEVKDAVYYAESRLKNECGSYMDDIVLMKYNVDEIEKKAETE